ncbi:MULTISPECIES: LysR family transcriptional regulator [Acetobacteraceae]|uniref:LysR family transcriptional regulator n=1 Tax=Acetobacteraceae TaxID=433 RepID=UPI000A3A0363|nr:MULTISPECIES: LysR family transcriptional regulator [Acetobacteraceae]OUI98581.1 LysR family transcriptional regulator [Acetobacter sp. DsW_54]
MDFLALADFTLVARHGGSGRASRAANRPKATLSRRVSDLEAALDLRLFERGARDLKLTEEGRALFERAGRLLTELEETANAIASGGEKPRGRLRVSVPLLFAQTAMGKIAAGFVKDYPDVRLEVTSDDREIDMVEEGYDMVIRVNPRADETLVGRPFLRDRLVIVAAPDVAMRPRDTAVPAVIRGGADPSKEWTVMSTDGPSVMTINPILSLSSMIMVPDAVRLGVGVGCLPLSLAGPDLAAGRLRNWGDAAGPETHLWALYPTRRLLSARVSAFLTYLQKSFPEGSPEELAAFL